MVFSPPGAETLGFIVDTGFKAGLALLIAPADSMSSSSATLSSEWLVANWNRWVFPDTPVADVLIDLDGRNAI
jgi:hypothetical protein